MTSETLLVELLTEELPPKALAKLGEVFSERIVAGLRASGLLDREDAAVRGFAAPRRLGVSIAEVLDQASAHEVTEKIMPVSVAFDGEGKPTQALLKKLQARGIPLEAIASFERRMDGKAEALFYSRVEAGAKLSQVLATIVNDAVKALPIPKVMRWGDSEVQFVRPVHKLTMLHDGEVMPGTVLGLEAGRTTMGHRFMGHTEIVLATAEDYEPTLLREGMVMPNFADRRAEIERQLQEQADAQQASLGEYADLLDEVTALVEHPTVYVGEFENEFLKVPQECLILTMRANQKYFPLFERSGRLTNRFLIVSNMRPKNPIHIITGNQRVVRPRLADARFFFDQDRKATLESRLPRLGSVVYHHRLGNQLQRVERLERLSGRIAAQMGADDKLAARAGRLAKADLVTEMVGEFPELQGVMGRYYALYDGEDVAVAEAVASHYQPRFAGDTLPQGQIAGAVALADKLDAMVGFFGIGLIPTGDKDPYGLRRAALGVLRILMETPLPLDLAALIDETVSGFAPGVLTENEFAGQLLDFIFDRLRNLLREAGHAVDTIDAVLALRPTRIDLVPAKLEAVRAFRLLPEAEALAAANKRIVNILRKNNETLPEADVALLRNEAEKALYHQVIDIVPQVHTCVERGDYTEALRVLAGLRSTVDRFFDEVMVMDEDEAVRKNRLATLKGLAALMNRVADISRLSV